MKVKMPKKTTKHDQNLRHIRTVHKTAKKASRKRKNKKDGSARERKTAQAVSVTFDPKYSASGVFVPALNFMRPPPRLLLQWKARKCRASED